MRNTLSLLSLATVAIASTLASPQNATAQGTTAQDTTAQLPNSGSITAKVSALRNQTGQVCFSLFDSSKGFPNDSEAIVETKCISASSSGEESAEPGTDLEAAPSPEVAPAEIELGAADTDVADMDAADRDEPDTQGTLSVTFDALPLGTYAVTAFHDENEDGEINQGGFGIPLEGFGFSQNPPITTRAPEFSETAIIVVGAQTTTEIELIYY